MILEFIEKPAVAPEELASLRKAVGWDRRLSRIRKTVGCCYYWVGCRFNGRLVGYVEVISDGVDDAYIRSLIVHPAYQKRGIGMRMLKMVITRIKADRIKTVNVLFEPELAGFYRKAGFRIVSGGLIDHEKNPVLQE